jgi:hypothetical protein
LEALAPRAWLRYSPKAHARMAKTRASKRPLGDSSTVEQRTLTPSILVRIQVPQPNIFNALFARLVAANEAVRSAVRGFVAHPFSAKGSIARKQIRPGSLTRASAAAFPARGVETPGDKPVEKSFVAAAYRNSAWAAGEPDDGASGRSDFSLT